MIDSSQILSFNHYKKGKAYTGSRKGMRYRIQKKDTEDRTKFCVYVWPEPFCYEKTDKEQITEAEFEFSEAGYGQVISYLNSRYEEGTWK
ncbi:MAG: GNAT family acetyltransferase [Lachnospiraceae bacterium]